MTIEKALRAAIDEFVDESLDTHNDEVFHGLLPTIFAEDDEIDKVLPEFVADALNAYDVPHNVRDERIYKLARNCIRLGMRLQRKLDRPDQKTTAFWRSDQRSV